MVRLIESRRKISEQRAKILKGRGGIYFDHLVDFAVSDKYAYSFERIAIFDQRQLLDQRKQMEDQGSACNDVTPSKKVMGCIYESVIDKGQSVVLVYHGTYVESFGHAAAFVKSEHNSGKQLLLLDSKNTKPIAYPKVHPTQDIFYDTFNGSEDIEGQFYTGWEIYALT